MKTGSASEVKTGVCILLKANRHLREQNHGEHKNESVGLTVRIIQKNMRKFIRYTLKINIEHLLGYTGEQGQKT